MNAYEFSLLREWVNQGRSDRARANRARTALAVSGCGTAGRAYTFEEWARRIDESAETERGDAMKWKGARLVSKGQVEIETSFTDGSTAVARVSLEEFADAMRQMAQQDEGLIELSAGRTLSVQPSNIEGEVRLVVTGGSPKVQVFRGTAPAGDLIEAIEIAMGSELRTSGPGLPSDVMESRRDSVLEAARLKYEDDHEVEINDDARVIDNESNGCWIQGWLLIRGEH